MRINAAGLMLAVIVFFANNAAADPLSEALLSCREMPFEERTRCYDQAVDEYVVADSKPADAGNGHIEESTDTVPAVSAEDLFGKSPIEAQRALEEASGQETIDRIEATVIEIQTIAPKRVSVRLDNGQVWLQADSSTLRLAEGDEIMIRRRSFGSHTLQKKGRATAMRVTRAY